MLIRYYVIPGIKRNLLHGFKRPNADVPANSIGIDMDRVSEVVCSAKKIPEEKILSHTRKREVVYARQLCMHLSWLYCRVSLKAIGERFGGHDHTTVIHANRVIKDAMDTDELAKAEVEALRKIILP